MTTVHVDLEENPHQFICVILVQRLDVALSNNMRAYPNVFLTNPIFLRVWFAPTFHLDRNQYDMIFKNVGVSFFPNC